jgi:hypothetical protein
MEHERLERPPGTSDASVAAAPDRAVSPPEPKLTEQSKAIGLARSALGGLGLLVLAAGVTTGVIPLPDFHAMQPAVAPAPVSINLQPQLSAFTPGFLHPLQASEVEAAITGMAIADADKRRLRKETATGDTRLAWIVVSDWDVEDGDEVLISAAGYAQQVRLYHRPTTLAVPYKPGTPVILSGAVDGDNRGITVAVHMRGAPVPLKLRLGEVVQVPTP